MNKEKIYVVQLNALDDQTYQTRGNKKFSIKKLNKALTLLPPEGECLSPLLEGPTLKAPTLGGTFHTLPPHTRAVETWEQPPHTHNHSQKHLPPPEPCPWLHLEKWVSGFPAGEHYPLGHRSRRHITYCTHPPTQGSHQRSGSSLHKPNHPPWNLWPLEPWPWML